MEIQNQPKSIPPHHRLPRWAWILVLILAVAAIGLSALWVWQKDSSCDDQCIATLVYPDAEITTSTSVSVVFETYDGLTKVRQFYEENLEALKWKKIADLGPEDATDCGGDWGGIYQKGNFQFKLHACGFADPGFLTSITFSYLGDTTPSDVFGSSFTFSASNPDPTANWQTYRNEEYGFEFRYPGDLYVFPQLLELGRSISIQSKNEDSFKIDFIVISNNEKLTLEDWRKIYSPVVGQEDKTKSLGEESIKISYVSTFDSTEWINIYIKEKNIVILFSTQKENEQYLNQILSTFKFIDSRASTCPEFNPIVDSFPVDTVAVFVKQGTTKKQVEPMAQKYNLTEKYFNTKDYYIFETTTKTSSELLELMNKLNKESVVRMATPFSYSTSPDPSKVEDGYTTNELIIKLKSDVGWQEAQEITSIVCGKIAGFTSSINMYQVLLPPDTEKNLEERIKKIENDPRVESVTKNVLMNVE